MSAQGIVEAYADAWLETAEKRRLRLIEQSWADDSTYTDPNQHFQGREALNQAIVRFQQRRPGERIVRTSAVDRHHDMVRFAWAWYGADGSVIMEGMDFGELADDGRLRRIVGFFGPMKERLPDEDAR
jgi:hypothetical protein